MSTSSTGSLYIVVLVLHLYAPSKLNLKNDLVSLLSGMLAEACNLKGYKQMYGDDAHFKAAQCIMVVANGLLCARATDGRC